MHQSQIPVRYAKALFQLSIEKGVAENVREDVQMIFSSINEIPELLEFLNSPVINSKKKIETVAEVFKGKLKESITLDFLIMVIKNKRELYLRDMARDFIDVYKKSKGIITVVITTASNIEEEFRKNVKDIISKHFSSSIELSEVVDEDIIGGMILRINDIQYDASIYSKLKKLKRELINTTFETSFTITVDPKKID